ncbi:MAG: N-acetylmuramoyl-L-alanine amidase [Atopobiaceae bacterium]|nr:N-acetylmuramoyl-L-alanine amidase [Atopobiaceae bacterium]
MADFSGNITADVWAPTTAYDAGRGGHSVQYIVVHHEAAIGLTANSIAAMWSRMQSQSAHYSVDGDGVIAQHVYESDTAWACGNWTANQSSISIEHANNSTNPWTVSEATLESGAHLIAALLIKYNLGYPSWGGNVRPHSQIVATACPGELAHSQNAHYMERVCYWYEVMTGSRSTSEVGWHTDGKGSWWYQTGESSDEYAVGWYRVGMKWYYFNASGWMLTGWVHASWDGSDKYWWYFDESGALLYDQWVKYNDGWYLLGSDGRMATGWAERDGKRYFLDGTGRMVTGWYHDDGDDRDIWYYFDSDGVCLQDGLFNVGADKICAFDKQGKLLTGDITVTTDNNGYISAIK